MIKNKALKVIIALALCILLSFNAVLPCFAEIAYRGDVNGDKKLDSLDTAEFYKTLFTDSPVDYDANGDGVIDIRDLVRVKKLVAKFSATEKFNIKFPHIASMLYRVGNKNAVELGSLFEAVAAVDSNDVGVIVRNLKGSAEGTFTPDKADWTKGKINLSGTGVVRIIIHENSVTTAFNVEVIDANNVTAYSGGSYPLKNYNTTSVLLNDITMSGNSALYLNGGATLYGNGFRFDCTNGAYQGSGSVSENYVIELVDAHLDNVEIIGKVYTEYGAMASNDYNRALVVSKGNSSVTNCYLSNTAAPVRIVEGSCTIKGSTLKGGNFANIDLRNGHLTVEDVTTVNQALGNDKAGDTTVIGLGIVVYYENVDAGLTSVTINGKLTQYNNISNQDKFSNDYANQFVSEMFGSDYADYQTVAGDVKWVNTGIVVMSSGIVPVDNRSDKGGYIGKEVKLMSQSGYAYTVKPAETDVTKEAPEYKSLGQGFIAPAYSFDYNTKNYIAKTEGSNDYCYYENGKVLIAMDQGDTFEWDPYILTATKSGEILDYTVTMNGTGYASGQKIAFNTSGDYAVTYTYNDANNYTVNENGELVSVSKEYTKTVNISVSVIKPAAQHATFTFADTKTATEKITVNDKTYISAKDVTKTDKEWGYITVNGQKIFYPITEAQMKKNALGSEVQVYYYVFKDAVTITDYTDGGTGSALTYNDSTTTMPSNLSVVNGMEAKYASIDSACVDISKLTKDGPSGEVWDFSASTTVSGTTKYNNYLAHSSPSGLSIKTGTRDYDAITVAQFSYTDAAGATYYYFVGYFMPNQVSSGSGSDSGCVTPDTLITLADGSQKRVDELKGDEKLLVWNLETGKYDEAPIVFVDTEAESEYEIIHLYFSNGSDVKVVDVHGFFDVDLKKYVYIDATNYRDYIGHSFVAEGNIASDNWNVVTLDNVVIETEKTTAWSPVTFEHLCYFTNGVLSMPGGIEGLFNIFEVDTDTMRYDKEMMQKDIETYGLFTNDDFGGMITEEAFEAFNGAYLKVALGKGLLTWEDIAYMAERYIPLM